MDERNTSTIDAAAPVKHLHPFDHLPTRFDLELMSSHSPLLGKAGDLLSRSYVVSGAVATIARIVRASQVRQELDEDHLDGTDESNLLSAIDLLAQSLNDTLCHAADEFENELSKGGGQ